MTQVGKILVLAIVGLFAGLPRHLHHGLHDLEELERGDEEEERRGQESQEEPGRSPGAGGCGQEGAGGSPEQRGDRDQAAQRPHPGWKIRTSAIWTDIQDVRGKLVTANENAKSALDEAAHRRDETVLLRTQKSAVEKQANEFKLRQAELIDKIRELERMMDTATHEQFRPPGTGRQVHHAAPAERALRPTSARSRDWRARRRSRV